jgi:DNA-binding CsgD family transcriptional regulator
MLSQVSAVARETNVAATILDHLSIPILLVDRNANVDYANLTARSLVADGVSLTIVDHIFGGRHRDGAASLRAAIVDTCVNGVGHAIVMEKGPSKPIVAVTMPFAGSRPLDNRALVMLRSGIGPSDVLLSSLRELFKLSSSEAEIAVALGGGADINEVARERGVKRNTLRSQLASIMERTGTHRQAELVALIARIDALT